MRTPKPRTDEIVRAIADRVGPRRDEYSLQDVQHGVRADIELLADLIPAYFDRAAIRQTRKAARAIMVAVTKLEALIRTAPPELQIRFATGYSPERRLLNELDRIRAECASAAETAPANDEVKAWCVRRARHLIVQFSTKPPTSSSAGSPFREISSLLFEALTGERGLDFKRACDELLRTVRQNLNKSQPK